MPELTDRQSDLLNKLGEVEISGKGYSSLKLKNRPQALKAVVLVVAEEAESRICLLCQNTLAESGHFYADEYYDIHEIKDCGTFHRLAQELRTLAEKVEEK